MANRAAVETMPRTVNTGLGAMFILAALAVLGGDSLQDFAIALLVGLIVGTYSSVFTATPLLTYFQQKWPMGRVKEEKVVSARPRTPAPSSDAPLGRCGAAYADVGARRIGCSGAGYRLRRDRGARRGGDGARRAGAGRPGGDGRGGREAMPRASTCSSRPAPAPASRWPTSSRRCSTTSASWSPPRPWRCSTSSSSATSRAWSRRSGVPGVDTSYAVLKGRSNYACLHRIREGVPDDQGTLVDVPRRARWPRRSSSCAAWAEEEAEDGGTGERDNAPRHTDREWRQVSRQPPRVPRRRASARSARSASPSWPGRRRSAPT